MTHFYAITPIRPSCGFRRSITADQIRERLEGWRTDLAAQRIAVVVNGRDHAARLNEIDMYLDAVDDEVIALAFDDDPDTLEMAALSNQLMSLLRAVQRTGVSVALPTLPVSP
jgi:hypothetical protein